MVIVGLPYTCSPVYQFPAPAPFRGARFYNPYEHLRGQWRRANLHAHGQAWGGLTNGVQASADVAQAYKRLGYDIAGVSNYHAIASHEGVETLPLYEHGYNVAKRHQLAIGASRVDWVDFPLWQWLSQEQYVIDRVARTAGLVGLTHPGTRDAYSSDDLRHLTGYHYIEIVNGPFEATTPWDAALSTGHAVWAMANDDTHDTSDPRRTAAAWTMIDAPSTGVNDIVPAMREGRALSVERNDGSPGAMDVRLTRVTMDGPTLRVETDGVPSDFEFVGQQGVLRAEARDTNVAEYRFEPDDTYIRTVIRTPATTMFLNPVMRAGTDGKMPTVTAHVDRLWSWALQLGTIAVVVAAAAWLWPVRRRTVETRPQAAPAESLQESE